MVIEHVRNVLGFRDAGHEEFEPGARTLAIRALSCSLADESHTVELMKGSRAAQLYGKSETVELFRCSYGLNEEFRAGLEDAGLVISGLGEDGTARIVELPSHPFFLATLYLPQANSRLENPHPLVAAFVAAALS